MLHLVAPNEHLSALNALDLHFRTILPKMLLNLLLGEFLSPFPSGGGALQWTSKDPIAWALVVQVVNQILILVHFALAFLGRSFALLLLLFLLWFLRFGLLLLNFLALMAFSS